MIINIVLGVCLFICLIIIIKLFQSSKKSVIDVQQIKIEKNNYQTISQQANDIILVIDIVNGKIHQANNKAAEMLGYSLDKLLQKSIFDLHAVEDLEKSSITIANVWEKKGLVYQNLPFKTSTGELLQVECSAKVLDYNNNPVIVIYARDIRERLKMEMKIRKQNNTIAKKNKNILDSIRYAQRIQESILPPINFIEKNLDKYFIYYVPRDIVSGDFYWIESNNDNLYVAAIDCTGHGVPGALLSVVGNGSLHRALFEHNLSKPSEILDKLNKLVIKILRQDENSIKDGMDIALCKIDKTNKKVEFAGANNPLFLIRKKELPIDIDGKIVENQDYNLIEIKGNKQPIGHYSKTINFTNHSFDYLTGDRIYLFSDGFVDQFGGKIGRKFLKVNFRKLLFSIQNYSMRQQHEKLNQTFNEWKKGYDQVDDICIIGIEL